MSTHNPIRFQPCFKMGVRNSDQQEQKNKSNNSTKSVSSKIELIQKDY